jgi:hypothetical protein
MAERIVNEYQRLFEVRVLHHYWLDEGATVFDLNPDQADKDARLLKYDVRPFLALAPTLATADALGGLGGVYKSTALGGVTAVPGGAVLPAGTTFDFLLTVHHAGFFNYTALTLRPQKVAELYHPAEGRTHRYKENVPVLSNLTGAARGSGPGKALFLSHEFPALAPDDLVESLVVSGGALLQLTSDQPGAATQELAPASSMPVFVNQADVPPIVPPPGLVGAPSRGIELAGDMPDTVAHSWFALIRLSAVRADDGDFSFIDPSGHARTPAPVFEIRFNNRSTVWQYLDKGTGAVIATEPEPLPLTYFGNAGTRQKPSVGSVKATFDSGAPSRVTRLVSEIYV